jgi:hypothetical protein
MGHISVMRRALEVGWARMSKSVFDERALWISFSRRHSRVLGSKTAVSGSGSVIHQSAHPEMGLIFGARVQV